MTDLSRKGLPSMPRAAAFLAISLACQACSGPGLPGAVAPIDTEVSVRESAVPAAEIEARVEQFGSLVTIAARGKCDLHRIRTVDQVTLRGGNVSRSSGGLGVLGWTAGLLVASGLAISSGVVVDKALAPNVVNPDAKMVNGVLLGALSLGVVGALIWFSAPRSSGAGSSHKVTERVEVDDGLVQANVPCGEVQSVPARVSVTGRLPGPKPVEVALGSLDSRGKLVIDLTQKLPGSVLEEAGTPRTMPVYVRGINVGVVRLSQ
jgi:hypothetical protein